MLVTTGAHLHGLRTTAYDEDNGQAEVPAEHQLSSTRHEVIHQDDVVELLLAELHEGLARVQTRHDADGLVGPVLTGHV